jgi:hypothetical protein
MIAARVTDMSSHTIWRAVALALVLTIMLGGAERASAASQQCDGCSAFIDAGGNVGRGRGVASAERLDEGRYELVFTDLVTKCAFTAPIGVTIARSPETVEPTMVSAVDDGGSKASTGVIVQTFDNSGVLSSQPFFLLLTCLPS